MVVEQLRRAVPGGIGVYARGLLSGLAASEDAGTPVDLTLFASRAPRRGGARLQADPLEGLGRPVVLSPLPGRILTRSWDHGVSGAPGGFDVVHSVSLSAPRRRARGGAAAVITVHDAAWRRHPEATTARGRRWHEAALRRARDSGAQLVVTSGFVAADLVGDGVEEDRITVVHGGSDHLVEPDLARTDAVLRALGVPGEFVLTVSTLEPRKNLLRLVGAYQQVRRSLPEPWPLLVVGPAGWGPALPPLADDEGVTFTGRLADAVLSGLYQRARAFVYVPLTEGYGLPPLEALRNGTPAVVGREVPSVHDLGETGAAPAYLVDPLSVDDIAEGLVRVLTDDPLRDDLSRRGRAHARARTWRAAADTHLALWGSLA